jgi:POT family proton-dependent oligopeptide transporter
MAARSKFPRVFWAANSIEILERIAYYGIYMGFGIYMEHLGFSKGELGIIQSIFLLLSYMIPVISGTFADRFGFKKVLIVSYLAYLPSILLLLVTKTFSGLALTMLCIGFAAGIFKPLISGTVRVVTDSTNKTLGFGIFYAMVNVGGLIGPIIAGKLRVISWNYAFLASAISIGLMLIVTLLFYKEPPREIEGQTLKNKFRDLGVALSDKKFLLFLFLLGTFFWLPFWAFFNLIGLYIDQSLDTARLYLEVKMLLGQWLADFLSHPDEQGVRRIIGESVGNTGIFIIMFQLAVSSVTQKYRAMPAFMTGLITATLGFIVLALAKIYIPGFVFLGILLFALGEMMASPRIQEYITWIAPKEKAGLYMGSNFLATAIGGLFSGVVYSSLFGFYSDKLNHPEYIWLTLAVHMVIGVLVFYLFTRIAGEFKEQSE